MIKLDSFFPPRAFMVFSILSKSDAAFCAYIWLSSVLNHVHKLSPSLLLYCLNYITSGLR